MQLDALPIQDHPDLRYSGTETAYFLDRLLSPFRDLQKWGLRPEEMPEDLFEGFVFFQFITGVTGQYTVNGSAFAQNWRWLPQAQKMAAKLGESALADQLSAAWEELKGHPEDLLDEFDACALAPARLYADKPDALARQKSLTPSFRVIEDDLFDRLTGLLDHNYDAPVKAAKGSDNGDGYTKLENALAEYIGQHLTLEICDTSKAYKARICESIDGLDDYPARIKDSDIIPHVRDMMLQIGERFYHWGYYGMPGGGNPVMLSQLWTTQSHWLVAQYHDRAQLIDFDTWEEMATAELTSPWDQREKRAGEWSYDDYPDWHLGADKTATATKFARFNPLVKRGPIRKRGRLQ